MHARVYDHAGSAGTRDVAPARIAFHVLERVGIRDINHFVAPWLACTFPCRRFADLLTDARARLGGDVARYAFIVVDSLHLRLAGLPAHPIRVLEPLPTPILAQQIKCVLHAIKRSEVAGRPLFNAKLALIALCNRSQSINSASRISGCSKLICSRGDWWKKSPSGIVVFGAI